MSNLPITIDRKMGLYLGAITLMFLLGLILGMKACTPHNMVPQIVLVPDTLHSQIPYEPDTIRLGPKIIPQRVTEYKPVYIGGGTNTITTLHDTVTKRDTILLNISPSFITSYPSKPKLVDGLFSNSKVILALMDTSGKVKNKVFNVDYSKYNYGFDGSDLRTISEVPKNLDLSPKKHNLTTEINSSIQYQPINQNIRLNIDYALYYKKIGLFIQSEGNSHFPYVNTGIGLRFRIK